MHRPDRTPAIAVTSACDRGASVDRPLKSHMRMEQRKRADEILDRSDLGVIRLKKFEAGRNVGEQVLDLERHSGQQRTRPLLDDAARSDANARARAAAFDIRHRCDAGQCFPAESQGGDGVEVRQIRDLAGGVPHECHLKVFSGDSLAVVADPD